MIKESVSEKLNHAAIRIKNLTTIIGELSPYEKKYKDLLMDYELLQTQVKRHGSIFKVMKERNNILYTVPAAAIKEVRETPRGLIITFHGDQI